MKTVGHIIGIDEAVHSVLPHDTIINNTLVGVEIELEEAGKLLQNAKLKYWHIKEDGSLRDDGIELVFKAPFGGIDIIKALDEVEAYFNRHSKKPAVNERTGLHVHIDVRDLSVQQFTYMMLLYVILEKPITHYCGDERANNIFCLPYYKAECGLQPIKDILIDTKFNGFNRSLRTATKYYFCNIEATRTYGSIEFRGHAGAWDKDSIVKWINILLSLKQYATTNRDIEDLFNFPYKISKDGPISLFNNVFGSVLPDYEYPEMEYEILEGVRLAQDIIYSKDMETLVMELRKETITVSEYLDKYVEQNLPSGKPILDEFRANADKPYYVFIYDKRRKVRHKFYSTAAEVNQESNRLWKASVENEILKNPLYIPQPKVAITGRVPPEAIVEMSVEDETFIILDAFDDDDDD